MPSGLGVNPKVNGMPDLELKAHHLQHSMLDRMIGWAVAADEPANTYFIRVCQLADKAVREWAEAREHLQHRVDGGELWEVLVAADHLESTVDATHRALLFATRLSELPTVGSIVQPLLPTVETTKQLRELRHAVQHIDEWTVWDEASKKKREKSPWTGVWMTNDGQAGTLAISDDGRLIHIADRQISFEELGGLLTSICQIASALSSDPTDGGRWPVGK